MGLVILAVVSGIIIGVDRGEPSPSPRRRWCSARRPVLFGALGLAAPLAAAVRLASRLAARTCSSPCRCHLLRPRVLASASAGAIVGAYAAG